MTVNNVEHSNSPTQATAFILFLTASFRSVEIDDVMNKHDIVRFGQTTLIALCVRETVRRTDCFPNRATTIMGWVLYCSVYRQVAT